MRVLMNEIHFVLTASFCRAFQELGVEVLLPGPDFAGLPARVRVDRGLHLLGQEYIQAQGIPNARVVGPEILDEEIDLLLITGHHVQRQMLQRVWPRLARWPGARLAFYSGNQLPHYRYDLARNLLSADAMTTAVHGPRTDNFLAYSPWIDYGQFPDGGPGDAPILRTYIDRFAQRYPRDFAMSRAIVQAVPGLGVEDVAALDRAQVAARMRDSMATLHLKPEEGYGYAVIESLASGRPVVIPRTYLEGRTMAHWLEPGRSAMVFTDQADAAAQLRRFLADPDFRHGMQATSARLIRERVDNAEQTAALGRWLANLRPQPPSSLWKQLVDLRFNHGPR